MLDKRKRIFLVGFMGAGKSTVGRILADKLEVSFLDLDSIIERKSGRSIESIFSEKGEEYFRKIESEALTEVGQRGSGFVISTGGGVILEKKNRDFMRQNGITIYLKADIGKILERISGDTTRPLLNVDEPRAKAEKLLKERSHLYEESDYIINTDRLTPHEVASKIITLLSKDRISRA